MNAAPARGTGGGGWLPALLLALVVNLGVFCLAPWLIQNQALRPKTPPECLSAYLPLAPPPPPPEEEEPPPPEPEPPTVKMKQLATVSRLPSPQVDLPAPQLDLSLSPVITSGPRLALPPALPGPPSPGRGDRPPLIAARFPPPYPYFARRRGIQGQVRVRFLVDRKGQVKRVEIMEAKPRGVFEDSVLNTVSRWRFSPAIRGGQPATAWVETTIHFRLQ